MTIVVWAALLIGAGAASAASFTVDSTGDATDASSGDGACATAAGECTLRAALEQSQAVGGSNAIDFDLPDPSTIDLTSALPVIEAPVAALDISGPGMQSLTVRRDSGGDYSVISIYGADVSISGMTITNGRAPAGAGILSISGLLVLEDVAVVRNTAVGAAGVFGGGVSKTGGTLRVRRSTISENSATSNGVGFADTFGGGIEMVAGTPGDRREHDRQQLRDRGQRRQRDRGRRRHRAQVRDRARGQQHGERQLGHRKRAGSDHRGRRRCLCAARTMALWA